MNARRDVAVIGMSGRFPGAADLAQFWDNLLHGRDGIARPERAALLAEGVPEAVLDRPGFVPAAPLLEDVDRFDAAFFNISPRDATALAPAMRLFLECCWEAFENAGRVPGGLVGVYAGANMSQYWRLGAHGLEPELEQVLGNDKDYLAAHVAYRLNLKGPALAVQTACSTSLVAVHMAAEALLSGQCDMALAGGAAVRVPHRAGYRWTEGSILSPDGVCRPFDAAPSGPVFGSGVGAVLLRRLEDALADGDPVRAVIRGSAVNNDGGGKAGFAAPGLDGQASVIAQAQARAGVPARSISYVEAHGTGTALGDPIEVAALTRAFRRDTAESGFCAIGSVKGNLGHLETAAGVAGLIKTVLALEHRELPPSAHFAAPNPEIDFPATPFVVNAARRPWRADGPLRAGVSSFGMGGTNAHVVLEEAPARPAPALDDRPHLLPLSARTPTALARTGRALLAQMRRQPALRLADVSYTLAAGRARMALRRALVCGSAEELAELLEAPSPPCCPPAAGVPRLGLSLDGALPAALARVLHAEEPAFHAAAEQALAACALSSGAFTNPMPPGAAFAAGFALARLLTAWGLTPSALAATAPWATALAACLEGKLTLPEAAAACVAGTSVPVGGGMAGHWVDPAALHLPDVSAWPGRRALLQLAARLWVLGLEPNPEALTGTPVLRVALPTYPFERQRFWVEETTSEPPPAVAAPVSPASSARRDAVPDVAAIRAILRQVVGHALRLLPEQVEAGREFIEMGADSLVLMESVQEIERRFGLRVPVRDLFESTTTVAALAQALSERLGAGVAAPPPAPVAPRPPVVALPAPAPPPSDAGPDDPRQRRHLAELVRRYNARTAGSKRMAAEKKPGLADVRAAAGFKLFLKEMLYPIVVERGAAGHVTDVDGNDYVDVTLGFGVRLFGHRVPFLDAALRDQLERDAPLGPENRDTAEAAALLREMTGVERVAFFTTGTEAVMTALRLARARSGRDGLVLFKGSYHGHADATLGIGVPGGGTAPLSAGVPADTLRHLTILDYGSEDALRRIEAEAANLAAVVVEPVQSRHPDHQPRAFLHALRDLTARHGIALVFDEMITGFRIGAGGAQAWFGVEADIVAYGKVVGGGMPVGVVGGKAAWMDGLDGGAWRFGDGSFPRTPAIFYAGTFNKNPWTMAAARAVLTEIRARGPALFTALNRRTAWLATELNAFFAREGIAVKVVHFASLFRFRIGGRADLFFFHMVARGIYIWEGRNCFLADAHDDRDVERVMAAARDSALALRADGLIEAAPAVPRHPVTAAQAQLLMLDRADPEAALAYNIHLTAALSGPVDEDALQLAVTALVRRHEVLRSRFPADADTWLADPFLWVPLQRHDLLPGAVEAWFAAEASRRFDLANGPLLRAHLLRLGAGEALLVLALPHVIGDGVTLNLLLRELALLYAGERAGRAAVLPEPVPFHAYAAWLESRRPALASDLDWWRGQLAAPLPVLNMPLDRPRPAARRHAADVVATQLDGTLAAALRRVGGARRATFLMVCLAAWQLLLHRISGDDDLLVGVPTAGRGMPGSETMAGYCTHLLPIRSRPGAGWRFADLLEATRVSLLDAVAHGDLPFAELLDALALPRDASRTPLLSATFNVDQPPPVTAMDGVTLRAVAPPVHHATYELALNVTETEDGPAVECRYHTALFDRARMEALLRQYQAVLRQAAADPNALLASFDLATGGAALPDPAAPLPEPSYPGVLELLLRQPPGAVAIRDAERTWRYREVMEEARGIARFLAASGVRPGDRVALLAPRNGRLACTLAGTWLAGAAFLVLDPGLPPARRQAMVEAGDARWVLDLHDVPAAAPNGPARLHAPAGTAWPEAGLPPHPGGNDPAYVVFTSGTTGVPRGILGTHKGVAQFLDWQRRRFGIGPEDRVAQLASLTFDVLLREVFLPLTTGAELHVPPQPVLDEPGRLAAWLAESGVTVLHAVPSRARGWLAAVPPNGWPCLRRVFLSGEAADPVLAAGWQAAGADGAAVVNFYGSTETTMIKGYRVLGEGGPLQAVLPMADTELLVLRGERPCGVGETGEVVVRTPFRTEGYLQGGAAATFVPSPFRPGEMLYRSGDAGRFRADGSVEILGRRDDQLKIRGVRVEPAEVRATLETHPAVAQAAVLAWPGADGPELAAYVVPRSDGAEPAPATLRAFLSMRLPPAAVPGAVITLPALPLLPNGKLDRRALPHPQAVPRAVPVPPRDETEALLLRAWHDVLPGVPGGVEDDVFAQGANSLGATQMVSRVRASLGIELPLTAVFENPTVAGLARYVSVQQALAAVLADPAEMIDGELVGP